jgi:hypothetical protein
MRLKASVALFDEPLEPVAPNALSHFPARRDANAIARIVSGLTAARTATHAAAHVYMRAAAHCAMRQEKQVGVLSRITPALSKYSRKLRA